MKVENDCIYRARFYIFWILILQLKIWYDAIQIKAVISCSTHKIDQQETRQRVKILKYDNPDHKIKLKIRQFQVMGTNTGQINNIGYKRYIGS